MKATLVYSAPSHLYPDGTFYSTLDCLSFPTNEIGWAGGTGQILRTTDGGRNWVNVAPPGKSADEIFAFNEHCCHVLNRSFRTIWSTFDAGRSWQPRQLEEDRWPTTFFFLDDRCGWFAGGNWQKGDPAFLMRTLDFGGHWEHLPLDVVGEPESILFQSEHQGWLALSIYDCAELNQPAIVDDDGSETYLLPTPKGSAVLRTEDGGHSWQKIFEGPGHFLRLQSIHDGGLALVGPESMMILAGDTNQWQQRWFAPGSEIEEADFLPGGRGLAIGCEGGPHYTSDFGATWTEVPIELRLRGHSVVLLDEDTAILNCGVALYRLAGLTSLF